MDVIYHIKALHRQGLTTREIAVALKINRESVLKYIKQPVILDTNKSTGIQYVQTSYNIWVPAQRLKYSGCMALRTNEVPNPFKVLERYRQRNAVKCNYRVLKNQIEGDRMLATLTSLSRQAFCLHACNMSSRHDAGESRGTG